MKGIVFNLLEDVVVRQHGANVWDDLLDAAGVGGSYTSLGSYPDVEIEQLVGAAADMLSLEPAEILRWFGQSAFPLLAERYPAFFVGHDTIRPFILSLNSIIHPEVRKLYPGAHCPHFRFEDGPGGSLLMGYDSARKLCALAHGFIEGAGAHFGEALEIAHLRCMHRQDDDCLISIRKI
jgi:Haem-NO-binding